MSDLEIIEEYLRRNCSLTPEQLEYELARFVRNPDIMAEMMWVFRNGRLPVFRCIGVRVGGERFTARRMMKRYGASTVYAAYSLLTQLREHPSMAKYIRDGLTVK